jgi:hypothetical protein
MKYILTSILVVLFIPVIAQFNAAELLCNTTNTNQSIHPMDYDGDGDMDIIVSDGSVSESGYHRPSTYTAQNFGVCENQGNSVFVYHNLVSMSTQVFWAFGDINGDGWLDFSWAEAWSLNDNEYQLNVRMSNSNFTYGTDQTIYSLPFSDTDNGFEFQFEQIGIGDINNDGANEVIAALNGIPFDTNTYFEAPWSNIYAFEYNSGLYTGPTWICETSAAAGPTGAPLLDIQVFDGTNDGLNDIVVQWFIGDGNNLTVIEAISSGIFATTPTHITDDLSWDFADYNGNNESHFTSILPYNSFLNIDNSIYGSYLAPSMETSGIAVIDADEDNDGDIIIPTVDGHIYYFEHIDTWPAADGTYNANFFPQYQLINMSITADVGSMSRMDYDGDDDQDLIFIAEGTIYVGENIESTTPLTPVIITVFFDENMNGVQDTDEDNFPFFSVNLDESNEIDPDILFANTETNEIQVSLFPEIYTITLNENFASYDLTTSPTISLDLSIPLSEQFVKFGLALNGPPNYDITSELNSNDGICGGTINHHLFVTNTGNIVSHGSIVYTFDDVHSFIDAFPAPASVVGNSITWNYDEFFPIEQLVFTVYLNSPNIFDIGSFATNTLVVNIHDSQNNLVSSESISDNYFVTCAYDPNDITENNGFTDAGYFLDGDALEYTIRFQNTGNAPAVNVSIENQLSDLLEKNTMQPIAWSHDFQLAVDEYGLAAFDFTEINLPDSTNNEAESHGFVTYRIQPISGLTPATVIENSASIFFDFNPPIITNTEVNTVYDCSDLEQTTASTTQACFGASLEFSSEASWIENITWNFEDMATTGNNYSHQLNENGVLIMHASNNLCDFSQEWELTMIEVTSNFAVNENVLIANEAASYQWYLNGTIITNATSQSFEISESGNYSVLSTDDNGCSAMSDLTSVTFTNIDEFNSNSFDVFPNPANQVIYANTNGQLIARFTLHDNVGKIVAEYPFNNVGICSIAIQSLADGYYVLKADNRTIGTVQLTK